MSKSLICLCLTGQTLEEDLEIVEKYRQYIDLVELRVDFLLEDERLRVREFPALVRIPCILTIRRVCDGGKYEEGEGSRTTLFARALAFADSDSRKNFAYVDFEEDFRVPSLEDAALAFGTKIIRSFHDMKNPIKNISEKINQLRLTGYEIPKVAFMPHGLEDVTNLFAEASKFHGTEQIVCAMGEFGLPSRIFAPILNSYLSYTSPAELSTNLLELGHCDPKTLDTMYRFHSIGSSTRIFGITGYPLKVTSSPKLHNGQQKNLMIDSIYIPFRSQSAKEAFDFAKTVGFFGYSVTIPHKEEIISYLTDVDEKVKEIGACNTVIREGNNWIGHNTDCTGFATALLEFVKKSTGEQSIQGKKVSVIGAGGASRAILYALKTLGADGCVLNRTIMKAQKIAEKFGFSWGGLSAESVSKINEYSDIIVQTTSKGMGDSNPSDELNDPIWFYEFSGKELVYDIIYEPEETPLLKRAKDSGCKICNGWTMLQYQALEQMELFLKSYTDSTPQRDRTAIIRMTNFLRNSYGINQ